MRNLSGAPYLHFTLGLSLYIPYPIASFKLDLLTLLACSKRLHLFLVLYCEPLTSSTLKMSRVAAYYFWTNDTVNNSSLLEWPMLWRITKNSLHSEGIYKWVNWAPIFFWYKLLPTTSGPQKFEKIRVVDFFCPNSFIFEPKVENIWVFFPLSFCHWSQFWHQKYWKNKIVNFKNADFCKLLRPRSSWK